VAEWLKAHAWKACLPQGNVGSNPTLSAIALPILLNLKINKRNKTGYMDSLLSHVSPEYLTVDPIPAQKPYQPYQAPVRENRSRTGKAEFVNSINGFPATPSTVDISFFRIPATDGWHPHDP
jgi:hypothetical protein